MEQIKKIIDAHNEIVDALSNCDAKLPSNQLLNGMLIWHKLACEGLDIVQYAKENGIDVVINMQNGRIIYK